MVIYDGFYGFQLECATVFSSAPGHFLLCKDLATAYTSVSQSMGRDLLLGPKRGLVDCEVWLEKLFTVSLKKYYIFTFLELSMYNLFNHKRGLKVLDVRKNIL